MDNHINTGPLPAPLPQSPDIDISETVDDTGNDPHAVPSKPAHAQTRTKFRQTYLDQLELNFPPKSPRKRATVPSQNTSVKKSPAGSKMGDSDRRMPLTAAGLWEFLFQPFQDKCDRFLASVQTTFTVMVLRDYNPVPALHPDNVDAIAEKFAANFVRQARNAWEIFLEGLPDSGHVSAQKVALLLVPASSMEVMMENIYFTDLWRLLADVADESVTALLQSAAAGDALAEGERSERFKKAFLSRDMRLRLEALVMREVCNVALSNDSSYVLEDYFSLEAGADILSRVTDAVRREAGQLLAAVAPPDDLQVAFQVLHMLSYGRALDLSGMRMEGDWPLVVSLMRRYGYEARQVARAAIAADPNLLLQECPLFPADMDASISRPSVLEICIVGAGDVIPSNHCDVILKCSPSRVLNQPISGLFSENIGHAGGALPLTLAAHHQGARRVKALLSLGASVFAMDERGTMLHNLVHLHATCDRRGEGGAPGRYTDKQRDTFSTIAHVINGHYEANECTEGRPGDTVTYQRALLSALSPAGYTPLEDAARLGCPDLVASLLDIEHVTCKPILRDAGVSLALLDLTEFERNAFLLSAGTGRGCQVAHKSRRSRFASDLLLGSGDPEVFRSPSLAEYVRLKWRQYFRYYVSWLLLHALMMSVLTLTGVYYERAWPGGGAAAANRSNGTVTGESGRPRALLVVGEALVALYALALLGLELYDTARYTNFRAELRHVVHPVTRRLVRGAPAEERLYSLYSAFRVAMALFSALALCGLLLGAFGCDVTVLPYGGAIILGWLVLCFLFGVLPVSLLFVTMVTDLLTCLTTVAVVIVGFSAAVSMCFSPGEATFSAAFNYLVSLYLYHGELDADTGVTFPPYVCACKVAFITCLLLVAAVFLSVAVWRTARLFPVLRDLQKLYVGQILLLIERRLPKPLRKRGYIKMDGRYYIVISKQKPFVLSSNGDDVSESESGSGRD